MFVLALAVPKESSTHTHPYSSRHSMPIESRVIGFTSGLACGEAGQGRQWSAIVDKTHGFLHSHEGWVLVTRLLFS